ncbi:MAG: hypothetical protein OEY14_07475, partial [Myxococcales bacterium]|nr:hypothetical protein [Myxococcales bacterium]
MTPEIRGLPIPLRELLDERSLASRLAEARDQIDETVGEARVEAALRYAVVAALSGESQEAEIGLKFARDLGERGSVERDLPAAYIYLRAGDPTRTLAALRRAELSTAETGPPEHRIFLETLRASALGILDEPAEGFRLAEQLLRRLPRTLRRGPLGLRARLSAAECALKLGDADAALEQIAHASSYPGGGLLDCQRDLLRAQAELARREPEPDQARTALSRAVWRLVQMGAARELGVSYLTMARVEAASGAEAKVPASWLARAHPIITRAGTPRDLEALRIAFRAYGRRAIDRLVDADLATRIDAVRQARARLRDVITAERETRDAVHLDLGAGRTLDDSAVHESLGRVQGVEEELIDLLEGLVIDRERVGHLVVVSRKIMPLEQVHEVEEAIPRLAMELC